MLHHPSYSECDRRLLAPSQWHAAEEQLTAIMADSNCLEKVKEWTTAAVFYICLQCYATVGYRR